MADPSGDLNYDPSNDPPGVGRRISLAVLGAILLVVLTAAYTLRAFWWQ